MNQNDSTAAADAAVLDKVNSDLALGGPEINELSEADAVNPPVPQNPAAAAAPSSLPPPPTNSLVTALLTDLYQITMTYAHWKNGRHNDPAIFELFFRKNPFGGEFTLLAGLDECLAHVAHFRFRPDEIAYLRTVPALQHCQDEFFTWLSTLDASQVTIRAIPDGTVVFPRVPLLIVEAPLAVGQLLETTLLTLINYPSLLATNAARMVWAAQAKVPLITSSLAASSPSFKITSQVRSPLDEPEVELPAQCTKTPVCVEFGLRRAQGPDGGFSASKYATVGGFVATSNVQAGKILGVPVSGTHAHAFVQAYSSLDQVEDSELAPHQDHDPAAVDSTWTSSPVKLLPLVLQVRAHLAETYDPTYLTTNDGELAAFIAYAQAFPQSFLCLIDTYETLRSGLLNFICVALVLDDLGYVPAGIRLDSGDLAYLSMQCASTFHRLAQGEERAFFHNLAIVASNDINEDVLHALNEQGHAITVYGIGTNLVTCQAQPALGCVYKLVEIDGKPRMKLSQEISKVLIPGKKKAFRLFGKDERPILDVMLAQQEADPVAGQRLLCRDPFDERKRVAVTPSRVEPLHRTVWEQGRTGPGANRTLMEAREAVWAQLQMIRPDILRYSNPTPYKVSVSETLFSFLHNLWQSETPVPEIS